MSAMAHEPLSQEELLLEGFLALGTPEGYRAEFLGGDIVVTPPPDGDHEGYISLIMKQVVRRSMTDMDFSGNKGLKLARGGRCPKNHAIPDGTWAPADQGLFWGADSWMPPDGVSLVAEVTSTRAGRDRDAKRHCYALGGIPLYLLVDREKSSVSLFSDPDADDYQQVDTRPFGKEIRLPEPFAFDLDTTGF
ncbi:Uma2 family endonuclease [Streptomyces boncukensis]|uniref:Uma2 family endonuclease n=1 Tax=Streptomyces boncukensis TaxID=2711219 RepID=A0A6G4X964_9ACTN|nr:Uma2 family endonuclease [Streptomyces boncukensis]NGO73201.1 Uma2 family endonuclease [Streptomyces boncukensis]